MRNCIPFCYIKMKNLVNKFVLTSCRMYPFLHVKSDPALFENTAFEVDTMVFVESCAKRGDRYDVVIVKDFKYYLLKNVSQKHFKEIT